jgi:Ca2+-binding RTX toxin-like protein
MPTIKDYLKYAETAVAGYATNLVSGPAGANFQWLKDAGMPSAEAIQFDTAWAVIAQSPSPLNGFSAVLLQNRTTGEKVLAIRGTEGAADYITDLVNIGVLGSVNAMPQYSSLETFYQSLVSSGKLSSGEVFTVTGHSLGGFLAEAFTAKHPSVVQAAYTYNAPGFGGVGMQLFEFLGLTNASESNSKIFNVRATDGVSFTAGLGQVIGTVQQVRIEAATADPIYYHSITTLTDALSVYKTYADLQPSLSMQQAADLFVSSGIGSRKLEDALDALRTVFIGAASNDSNRSPTGNREKFYSNLEQLQKNANFKTLSGQVQLLPANASFASAAKANTDAALAYRYALQELLPFAVVANTAAQNQTLYGPYTQRLSLYDAATGQGELTQNWIADRAVLLQAVATRNNQDSATGLVYDPVAPAGKAIVFQYQDAAGQQQTFITQNKGGTVLPEQYVFFGGDGADTLTGSDVNKLGDHLYGGAGADTLSGLGGNDYLEGNAGDDILIGGAGNDILVGGANNDTYKFEDNFGHDTIVDSDGSGTITINGQLLNGGKKVGDNVWESADKKYVYTLQNGNLVIGQRTAANASTVAGTILVKNWQSEQLGITLDSVSVPLPLAPTNRIYNGDQRAKLIGIEIGDPDSPAYNYYAWNRTSWLEDGTLVDSIAEPNFSDVIYGSNGNDTINGFGGNDALDGGGGDDAIDGGVGDDFIGGSAGSDTITGGDGNDIILSATGLNVNQRSKPLEPNPFLAEGNILLAGPTWAYYRSYIRPTVGSLGGGGSLIMDSAPDVVDGGAGDDMIIGGLGNDFLKGGSGKDEIWGHGGDDTIDGGDGADILNGDGGKEEGFYETAQGGVHGADVINGGAGDDSIYGQGQGDILLGGSGADYIRGDDSSDRLDGQYDGNDYIDGGEGGDWLQGDGKDDTVFGGSGNDLLQGDATDLDGLFHGNDYLDGGEGNDALYGQGGDDQLYGGEGNDYLEGDAESLDVQWQGNDQLDGGAGDDVLLGQGGRDQLHGGSGSDALFGGNDEDTLFGDSGDDYLDGGDGDDTLDGGDGSDYLVGGAGNDTITVGAGDTAVGGAGDDTYYITGPGTVVDKEGNNTYYFSAGVSTETVLGGVTVTYVPSVQVSRQDTVVFADGGVDENGEALQYHLVYVDKHGVNTPVLKAGNTTISLDEIKQNGFAIITPNADTENTTPPRQVSYEVVGGAVKFTEVISQDDAVVSTQGGDDVLLLEAQRVVVNAGAGDDLIYVNQRDAVINGGAGDDTIDVNATNTAVVLYGEDEHGHAVDQGLDSITLQDVPDASNVIGLASAVLDLGPGVDLSSLVLSTFTLDDAGKMSVVLQWVTAGSDGTSSLQQSVSINMGTLDPMVLAQRITLRSGDSTLLLSERVAQGVTVQASAGLAAMALVGTDGQDTLLSSRGDNTLNGGAGNDYLYGGDGNDVLLGGIGNDHLEGGAGNNYLDGGAGNDVLIGSNTYGVNTLIGGDGDDVIDGGPGVTTAIDGQGADTYVMRTSDHGGGLLQAEFYGSTAHDNLLDFADANAQEVSFVQYGDNLQVKVRGEVVAELQNVHSYALPFAGASFANGDKWDAATLAYKIYGDAVLSAVVQGTAGDDTIRTGDGDDIVFGGDGRDFISGGVGDDILDGGAGDDTLEGGDGNDELRATSGVDIASGGAGRDTYVVSAGVTLRVIDSGDEVNVLRFANAVDISQITFQRNLGDLELAVPASNGQAASSLVIKDFGQNQLGYGHWLVEVGNASVPLSSILPAELAPATVSYANYLFSVKANLTKAINGFDPNGPNQINQNRQDANPTNLAALDATDNLSFSQTVTGRYTVHVTGTRYEVRTESTPVTEQGYRNEYVVDIVPMRISIGGKLVEFKRYVNRYATRLVEVTHYLTQQIYVPVQYSYDQEVVTTRTDIGVREWNAQGTTGDDTMVVGSRDRWPGIGLMAGNEGNDILIARSNVPLLNKENLLNDNDTLYPSYYAQGMYLDGGSGNDVLVGSNGNDVLNGGTGADKLTGGGGADIYAVTAGDTVTDLGGGAADQSDTVVLPVGVKRTDLRVTVSDWLPEELTGVTGNSGMKAVHLSWSETESVTLVLPSSYFSNDRVGSAPRSGARTMYWGTTERLTFDQAAANQFAKSQGVERIEVDGQNISLSDLLGSLGVTSLGGNSNDAEVLAGTAADDVLIGGGGADTLVGGDGDDVLIGDRLVIEGDGVSSSASSAGELSGTLDGPGDVFVGGRGNDTGWLTAGADTIRFNMGDGVDTYKTWETNTPWSFYYGLSLDRGDADPFPEQIGVSDTVILGGGLHLSDMHVTKVSLDPWDTTPWREDLVVTFDGSDDKLTFAMGGHLSLNFVEASDAGPLLGLRVVNGEVSGGGSGSTTGGQTLQGTAGSDILYDSAASLAGGLGDDTYVVTNASTVVIEQADAGNDSITSNVDYTLPQNVERLVGTGNEDLTLTGSSQNGVTLVANNANDTLIAGSGIATLVGGTGNDTFVVNHTADVVQAKAAGNTNTILSSVSYTASDNVQVLTGTGLENITLTGNDLDMTITGNAGDDTVVAGSGNNQIYVGHGNNSVTVGDGNNSITTQGGVNALHIGNGNTVIYNNGGTDTLYFSPSVTTEDLTFSRSGADLLITEGVSGSSVRVVGGYNSTTAGIAQFVLGDGNYTLHLDNGNYSVVAGNGNNQIDGGDGDVTLTLGGGDDTVNLGNGNNHVVLGEGNNYFTVGGNQIPIGFWGGAATDTFTQADGSYQQSWTASDGSYGMNSLNAVTRETISTLISADANALSYFIDQTILANGATEVKVTYTYAGISDSTDSIRLTQADGSYQENWTASDGRYGMHTWSAATGEDIVSRTDDRESYTRDNTILADGATESQTNQSFHDGSFYNTDTITKADGLSIQSWSEFNGDYTSHGTDYVSTSENASDTLTWGLGQGKDTIQAPTGNMRLSIASGIDTDQLWFSKTWDSLEINILGTDDQMISKDWYAGGADGLKEIALSNGQTLAAADVDQLVQAMAAFAPPTVAQLSYTEQQQQALAPVLAASWH